MGSPRRMTFKEDLKAFKAFINWYIYTYDHTYRNPVTSLHMRMAIINHNIPKEKKLSQSELSDFLECLKTDAPLYYYFAVVQCLLAGRVGEIAALRRENILINESKIIMDSHVVWDISKKFLSIENGLKIKGSKKIVDISNTPQVKLFFIKCLELYENKSDQGLLFFDDQYRPLSYRKIQYRYNKALKKIGSKVSGTHMMRHTSASIARSSGVDLNSLQAILGHKDQKVTQHYAALDDRSSSVAVSAISKALLREGNDEL